MNYSPEEIKWRKQMRAQMREEELKNCLANRKEILRDAERAIEAGADPDEVTRSLPDGSAESLGYKYDWGSAFSKIWALKNKAIRDKANPHGDEDDAINEPQVYDAPQVDYTEDELRDREAEVALDDGVAKNIVDKLTEDVKAGILSFSSFRDELAMHRNMANKQAAEEAKKEALNAGANPTVVSAMMRLPEPPLHQRGEAVTYRQLRESLLDYAENVVAYNKNEADHAAEDAIKVGADRADVSKLVAGTEADGIAGRPPDYVDLFDKLRALAQEVIGASEKDAERVKAEAIKAGVELGDVHGLWAEAERDQKGVFHRNYYLAVHDNLLTLIREKEALRNAEDAKASSHQPPDFRLLMSERALRQVERGIKFGDGWEAFWAAKALAAAERAINAGANIAPINDAFEPEEDAITPIKRPDYHGALAAILAMENATRDAKRAREEEHARQEERARQEEAARQERARQAEEEDARQADLARNPKQPKRAKGTARTGNNNAAVTAGQANNPGAGPAGVGGKGGTRGALNAARPGTTPSPPLPPPPAANFPPPTTNPIRSPPWPDRPDLSTEVTWAPLCTPEEHRRAYRLWDHVDSKIDLQHFKDQRPATATTFEHEWMDVLGFRVYEAMRQDRYPPFDHDGGGPSGPSPSAGGGRMNVVVDWNERHGLADIFPLESEDIRRMGAAVATGAGGQSATQAAATTAPNVPAQPAAPAASNVPVQSAVAAPPADEDLPIKGVLVDGRKFSDKFWRKDTVNAALEARNLDSTEGKVLEKKKRLFQHQVREDRRRDALATAAPNPANAAATNSAAATNANANATQGAGSSGAQNGGGGTAPVASIQNAAQGWSADFQNRLPQVDLGHWGIRREGQFILDVQGNRGLNAVDCLTWAILLCGYNPTYWVSRAFLFYELGFYDLALGDCYRAFRLIETLEDPERRNVMPGLYIRIWNAIEGHIYSMGDRNKVKKLAKAKMRGSNGVNYFIPTLRRALHHIISKSLFKMQCWEDYLVWDEWLTKRLLMVHRDKTVFEERRKEVEQAVRIRIAERNQDGSIYFFEKRLGFVEGKAYPQAAGDVNRRAQVFRNRINESYLRGWKTSAGGALEVLPWKGGLGVFATRAIAEDEIIYTDEPSARGHLDRRPRPPILEKDFGSRDEAQNFVQDPRCENCRRLIDVEQFDQQKTAQDANPNPPGQTIACACSDDTIVAKKYFCHEIWELPGSPNDEEDEKDDAEQPEEVTFEAPEGGKGKRKRIVKKAAPKPKKKQKKGKERAVRVPAEFPRTCLEIACRLYHYRSCGRDWDWLQKAMMPIWHLENRSRPVHDTTTGIRGGRYLTHNNEKHGTVLSMILRDVFDITLLQRTDPTRRNILAHETEELLPLHGAEHDPTRLFPFGWAANILVPFEMLLNLGVDIFTDLTFDTWVIQTVLHKLLANVVPWDEHLRRDTSDVGWFKTDPEAPVDPPRGYAANVSGPANTPVPPAPDGDYEEAEVRAEIENVYLHTGFALFNHACALSRNAAWMWDTETPNRIVVKASEDIAAGDQIFVDYLENDGPDEPDTNWERARLFGGPRSCRCPHCKPNDPDNEVQEEDQVTPDAPTVSPITVATAS